jgi:calcineurin-like phosphoesterase family protein
MTQTLFFTSDTHFGHANVIKYSKRPFGNVNEMNEALIEKWNARVKPNDIVWHLGDFAFLPAVKAENILCRLNGKKRLILGNHDSVIEDNKQLHAYFELIEKKRVINIPDQGVGKYNRQQITLNHTPELTWESGHHGAWMLHGHCHGTTIHPWGGKIQDIGVDAPGMNYAPISYEELKALMAPRAFSKHHGD